MEATFISIGDKPGWIKPVLLILAGDKSVVTRITKYNKEILIKAGVPVQG